MHTYISRDVDLATHKLSESEMQLRTMYRVEYKQTKLFYNKFSISLGTRTI
jgi:hypothetical protein